MEVLVPVATNVCFKRSTKSINRVLQGRTEVVKRNVAYEEISRLCLIEEVSKT